MKNIVWKVQCVTPPAAIRHCKKCGKKTEYISSGQFRVNAQRRSLDIWLIYKCATCDTTWNVTIYSRIKPNSISGQLLECFHRNDEMLAKEYAMNVELLRRNGAEVQTPIYTILGEAFTASEPITLHIKSDHPLPVKVSTILRDKLQLSRCECLNLIDQRSVCTTTKQSLRKLKLHQGATLFFNTANTDYASQ